MRALASSTIVHRRPDPRSDLSYLAELAEFQDRLDQLLVEKGFILADRYAEPLRATEPDLSFELAREKPFTTAMALIVMVALVFAGALHVAAQGRGF
jgi:hypothetical protein